jgi:S-formylglutathione hydrolase FrmB
VRADSLAWRRGPGRLEEVPIRPWSVELRGKLEESTVASEALRDNPLGDPHERPLWVYLPPTYEDDPGRAYPSIYLIQGLTGQIDMWRNRRAFRPSVLELVDELFADDSAPPAIVVFVDAWTSLGGSQFLDSPATGNYHTYLCDEVVPWVDARYRTLAERDHRGITGKSSGGYGAMVTPMLRPDLWGGLATHAGDALFENAYLPEFRQAARTLRDDYDGSFEGFWEDFGSRPAFTKESDAHLLNVWCMAACYSADPDGAIRLPFELATGRLIPEIWERWLAWDPVRMVPEHAETLRSLRAIYIDSGRRDEYYLDLGAEAFRSALERIGVTDVFFELFDATHANIEYRYPLALRYLAERLTA